MAKVALGKGLGALINTRISSPAPAVEEGERVQQINVDQIVPSPLQPRSEFRGERLQELVDSIREHSIIQPLIVRKTGDKFELIAGERRWRAACEVGLTVAPAIVREASDQEVLELALIENLQREDLNAIEEAQAFTRLAREFGLRQEDIARKVGKSRATIANSMRLLELHPQVQTWLAQGLISVGHAKVLLALKSPAEQLVIAEGILRHHHTVRAVEKLVARQLADRGTPRPPSAGARAADNLSASLNHLQNRLQQHLATRVVLHHSEKRGQLEIEYYGSDDLQRIVTLLGLGEEE